MSKAFKIITKVIMTIFVLLVLAEVIIRLAGKQPITPSPYGVTTAPGDMVLTDSVLGYKFNKGEYLYEYRNKHRFKSSHSDVNIRWCGDPQQSPTDSLLILGCSFVYGSGVDDSFTMPFYLQQHLKETSVVNGATAGYGTLQQFLRLQQYCTHYAVPAKVLLCYASFHNERNVLSRRFQKNLFIGYSGSAYGLEILKSLRYPVVGKEGKLHYTNPHYPLYNLCTYSALVNAIDDAYNAMQENGQGEEETLKVLEKMAAWTKSKGIKMYLFSYTDDTVSRRAIALMNKNGVATSACAIPLFDQQYSLLPYDMHPNAKAHKQIAAQIYSLVQ